jgi:hypothetical protein
MRIFIDFCGKMIYGILFEDHQDLLQMTFCIEYIVQNHLISGISQEVLSKKPNRCPLHQ